MTVFLKALALSGYRGIGSAWQKMPEFKTFNFFIGANNAGKSTVLNFISRYLPIPANPAGSANHNIDPLERHNNEGQIGMALGISKDEAARSAISMFSQLKADAVLRTNVEMILSAVADTSGYIWTGTSIPYAKNPEFLLENDDSKGAISENAWRSVWRALSHQDGGDFQHHWYPETLAILTRATVYQLPPIRLIPAIRQIGQRNTSFSDLSGSGLIDELAKLQNPTHYQRSDRTKFNKINEFLRSVTGKEGAEIEIPHDREHVLVNMDGRILPLDRLGTGIQEVVMIAAFCTIYENEIICIEEPEIHLHPLLQRKLIKYLGDNTKNQYFIATHSAAFIDTQGAAIFHVALQNGTTHIREAILKKDRFAICVDLGHRASDIVQANSVIWVEGPSDRIYLKHWISLIDAELIEGIHYSIMFYGGRLLSHLSADDDELSEFIQLRALNRNVAILIDSDKSNPRASINATKQRVRDEFDKYGGIAWVTKGREVENYVDHARLQRAISSVYKGRYVSAASGGTFDNALTFNAKPTRRGKPAVRPAGTILVTDVDKVKVSRAVVADGGSNLAVLDLSQRVRSIVDMIRQANA